jgi:hypothetical protein
MKKGSHVLGISNVLGHTGGISDVSEPRSDSSATGAPMPWETGRRQSMGCQYDPSVDRCYGLTLLLRPDGFVNLANRKG